MTPWFRRLADVRGRRTQQLAKHVENALPTFRDTPGHGDVLAAVLGHVQVSGKRGRVTDGPFRLAVLTAEAIILVDPSTGRKLDERPITQLQSFFADIDGRFLLRFDDPHHHTGVLAAFRPVAACDPPDRSARAAGLAFVGCAVDAWEARTGKEFVNSWQRLGPDRDAW